MKHNTGQRTLDSGIWVTHIGVFQYSQNKMVCHIYLSPRCPIVSLDLQPIEKHILFTWLLKEMIYYQVVQYYIFHFGHCFCFVQRHCQPKILSAIVLSKTLCSSKKINGDQCFQCFQWPNARHNLPTWLLLEMTYYGVILHEKVIHPVTCRLSSLLRNIVKKFCNFFGRLISKHCVLELMCSCN